MATIDWPSIQKKLPRVYEAVNDIYSHATKPGSAKMQSTLNNYSAALIAQWTKSFGAKHVLSAATVKQKLKTHITKFHNQVYIPAHRNTGKKKETASKESLRRLSESWRKANNIIFDIGKDMASLDPSSDEAIFYKQQKEPDREGRVTEKVDEEYEEELRQEQEQNMIDEAMDVETEDPEDPNDVEVLNSTISDIPSLNVSVNRSGTVRAAPSINEIATQTDPIEVERKKLRINKRVCTDDVNNTCAILSSTCSLSTGMSRKVVQVVCKNMYGHELYLTPEEQAKHEGTSVFIGSTKEKDRTYVLPSARTISDHKQFLATETETDAGLALLDKDISVKAFIHFDTTSRSNIDGDWPSIILRFTNGEEFRLRPLFFAYEDREQITLLFTETLGRLAAAASIRKGIACKPSDLWEKIFALMTDSPTKNLGIEETIATSLGSNHIPLHLLCKSHTVEALDRSNLDVLSKVEKDVKQRETLEKINPRLKSFFRGKTATVEAGIEAILKLVTHNKSANSCSQADLFERICEREGQVKRIFLYQQRRFAKLGKAAASILNAKEILNMLLDEIQSTNQLTESCRIYMSSELFMTQLECLAFFNHYVTFPFLNCVEISSQEELLQILRKLYADLLLLKTDTLNKFVVNMRGIPVPTLTTDVAKEIVGKMCESAAESIKRQCGREYGFADDDEELRATDLSTLTSDELDGLPTNNCINERDLSKFDKEAIISKCRNRKFRAKNIRNNMVLYKSKKAQTLDRISKKIALVLAEREKKWDAEQWKIHNIRLQGKIEKAKTAEDYVMKLLKKCKTWNGPVTTGEELRQILSGRDDQETMLRTEMSYYAHTHKADKIGNRDLFRILGISFDEMLENLTILLDDDGCSGSATVANLPTNDDVMKTIKSPTTTTPTPTSSAEVNELCVVVWQEESGYEWYLGYIQNRCPDGKLSVDHLHRELKNSDSKWKYPTKEDVQEVDPEQIVKCKVQGEWDLSADSRKRLFTVTNIKTITFAFQKHVDD